MNKVYGAQVLEYKQFKCGQLIESMKVMRQPIIEDPVTIQIDISEKKLQEIKDWTNEYKMSIFEAIECLLTEKAIERLYEHHYNNELGEEE